MEAIFFDEKAVEKLFPFYFVLDKDLNIVRTGKSIAKLMEFGASFGGTFRFLRPGLGIEYTFDSILSYVEQIFIFQPRDPRLTVKFKGQFVYCEARAQLIFCGSPWITSEESFQNLNLHISDFAIHDSVVDMLQMINTQRMGIEDRLNMDLETVRQRAFYQNLFDNIPVDIALIDKDHKYRYLNKSAVKSDEVRKWLIGKTITEYYSQRGKDQEFIDFMTEQFNQALSSHRRISFETVHNENREDEKIMQRIILPFDSTDGKAYLLAYGFDVTELKKGKRELIVKNSELQKLNGELDNLIYSVTHDLRSPVLSVMGLIDLAMKTGKPGEDLVVYLNMMRRSMDRLDGTIREILAYSRNAKTELDIVHIDISAMVQDIFENVCHSPTSKVVCTHESHGSTVFYSDQKRVLSVLNNLISNAVKYSRKGHTESYVKVKIETDDNWCVIVVEDNGEGIPYEHQEKVFNMFYRASTTSTGSGLGLFICFEVIKKLEGQISLKSVPGQGSIFRVAIPNKINEYENGLYIN